MTPEQIVAFFHGKLPETTRPPAPADVRAFACRLVREHARLVTPASPMRWGHTLRQKVNGKTYRVTMTLEEVPPGGRPPA